MTAQRVVIVGGGFAGLSAAYALMKRGITPLLLEAEERVGGRGRGEKVDGFSLDMGAFVFTSTYDTAFRLCEELGLPLVPSKMKFGHRRNGRWVTTTPDQSLWNFVTAPPYGSRDGLPLTLRDAGGLPGDAADPTPVRIHEFRRRQSPRRDRR